MTFTQDLLDALAPMMYAEGQTGNALADYLGGLGKEFELVETWASDTDTDVGWSLLLDVDRCPVEALPWLAQIVGLTLPSGLSAADQRSLIKTTPNWKRGTVGALQGAAAPFLTGNKTVILRERYDGSGNDAPYYLQVITYASETPVEDWPATNLSINGGLETNTNNWAPGGTNTFVRSTARAKFGKASGLYTVVNPGTAWIFTPATALSGPTAGLVYTSSLWMWAEGTSVGKTIQWEIRETGGASANTESGVICTLVPGWNYVVATYTIVANDRTALTPYVSWGAFAAGDYCYIDGHQTETGSRATPYIETDGTIASRPAGQGLVGKALLSQKAGGIIMTYNVVFGQDYQTLKNNNATYQIMKNRYPTYDGVKSDTGV